MKCESELFRLTGSPKPAPRSAPQKLDQPARQAVLFCGLDDSPGQQDLFTTDGPPVADPLDEEETYFAGHPQVSRARRRLTRCLAAGGPTMPASRSLVRAEKAARKDLARRRRFRSSEWRLSDQTQPGDVILPAKHELPAWLLFMRHLADRATAQKIAREEGGDYIPDGPYHWAVIVPRVTP